jgi:hypothetical protein
VIPELVRRLSDKSEPFSIRKRIPKALALTGKQEGADALLAQLHRLDYQLDHAVMRALNRMRVNSPEINIDAGAIHDAVAKEHEEFRRMRGLRSWLQANSIQNEVCPLLIRALGERSEERLERIFRLVALIYPPHDVHLVYYNCRVKPALRPSAIEFLDNLLEAPLKEMVVPLLEEIFDPEPDAGVEPQVHYISQETALDPLIFGEDPWLKAIAAELRERLSNDDDRLGAKRETRAG